MKNSIPFLAFCLFLAACQPEPKQQSEAASAAETPAAENQPGQANAPAAAPAKQEAFEPEVSSRPASEPKRSQDVLYLSIGSAEVAAGTQACVPVVATNFSNLLAMQYTIRWDASVLEFKEIRKPGLPFLDQADFGKNRVDNGLLTFVWINDALEATTVPDGSTIYELCFTAKGKAGQESQLSFVERPTPFEVVNSKEEILQLRGEPGRVRVK